MKFDFSGKIALVTGATRGIGKAIAESFLDLGAEVIITGTGDVDVAALEKAGTKGLVHYLRADFSDEQSILDFLSKLEEFQQIDICVNNAGVNRIQEFRETSLEDYEWIHAINLKAPYMVLKTVAKKMVQNGYGRIVNIASIWSVVTRHSRSLYTTTKCGLVGLTKTLSVELASKNVLVNAVSPGFTMTELTMQTNTPDEIEKIAGLIPIERFADTSEIASVVVFLCSDLNTYLTGQNIVVDGGYTNI